MPKKLARVFCLVLLSLIMVGSISAAEVRYENGRKVEGDYKDGKKNGVWTYYNAAGGKMRQETYQDGVWHGKYCRWDDNGCLLSEENWQAGKRHGKSVEYWNSGAMRSEGIFHEGSGKLTGYFPSGQKEFEREYKNGGEICGEINWTESGKKTLECTINEAGQYDGSYIIYQQNEQKRYEIEYKDGMILKIIEYIINDGKTIEKIWEPVFNKGGGLGGFKPRGVEDGVNYIMLGLQFVYDSVHKQYLIMQY